MLNLLVLTNMDADIWLDDVLRVCANCSFDVNYGLGRIL
jgi:hypothetical protein